MITLEQFQKAFPKSKNIKIWVEPFNTAFVDYEINTPIRQAAFLAQCAHESAEFTRLNENLMYSAEGLQKIFKKYFPTAELATEYAKKPEKIANKVYGNRMGNGDEASGDGYRFRGRGLIQLTGRSNYTKFSQDTFKDNSIVEDPGYCETVIGAVKSACWFWKTNNLNECADKEDLILMTKKINGGIHGFDDRIEKYKRIKAILTA